MTPSGPDQSRGARLVGRRLAAWTASRLAVLAGWLQRLGAGATGPPGGGTAGREPGHGQGVEAPAHWPEHWTAVLRERAPHLLGGGFASFQAPGWRGDAGPGSLAARAQPQASVHRPGGYDDSAVSPGGTAPESQPYRPRGEAARRSDPDATEVGAPNPAVARATDAPLAGAPGAPPASHEAAPARMPRTTSAEPPVVAGQGDRAPGEPAGTPPAVGESPARVDAAFAGGLDVPGRGAPSLAGSRSVTPKGADRSVKPEGADRAASAPVGPAGEPTYVAGGPTGEAEGAPAWVPEPAVPSAEASFVADAVRVQAALEWVTDTRAPPPTASFEPPRPPERLWPPLPQPAGGGRSPAAVPPPAADHAHLARLAREQEGR